MEKEDLNAIVARNLDYFMRAPTCLYKNPNALAVAAGVSANSVRNLLDPRKRTTTADKPDGFPQLDTLLKLTPHLGCKVWELLHPDIERSKKEQAWFKQAESDFNMSQRGEQKTDSRSKV